MRRLLLAGALGILVALAGCGSTPAPTPPPPPPTASPAAVPHSGACHQLTYAQAVASSAPSASTPCTSAHTTETYAVGDLDTVVDGHLLAISSARVQSQVAAACPTTLTGFLGGSQDALRLSMLQAVWFTPTPAQEARGAQWYRCDVVALSGASSLASLSASLRGALSGTVPAAYAMCGTAKPGTSGFQRVPCAATHTWKAVQVVDLTPGTGGAYPGVSAVQDAGTAPCKKAAQDRASNALDYQWGYDWPSAEQWSAGQTYGVCWVTDKA